MTSTAPQRALLAACTLAFFLACGGGGASSSAPAPVGPSITAAPTAQAGYPGDSVTYHVVAAGSGNSYQWLRNGTAISAATTDTYVLPVQVADDQAHFSVRVSASAGGSTTSPDAVLDVLYAVPAVVAGHDHTLAITTRGRVYAWGVGGNGQLGLGDYQARMVPTAVALPGPAVRVAAGWGHSLALLADGRVFAWGNNDSGQLGDGTTTMRNTPGAVPGMTTATFITCGYRHNFVVTQDQSIWVWGSNTMGQLGLGDKADRPSPVALPGLTATFLADISLGELHSLMVGTDGSLYGCGDNSYGQLGASATPGFEFLTFYYRGGGYRSARAFALYSVALGSDGLAYGTGENVYGQLGDGSSTTRYGWVAMGTGGLTTLTGVIPGQYHTHLLSAQGQLASTGYNWYGQLGLGTASTTATLSPQPLAGLTVLGVSAGSLSSYAWLPDLTVKAWGYNNNGRLGDGTATDHSSPTTVPGLFLGPLPTGTRPAVPVRSGGLAASAGPASD